MKDDNIKPCAYCGAIGHTYWDEYAKKMWVKCVNSDCCLSNTHIRDVYVTIDHWDMRYDNRNNFTKKLDADSKRKVRKKFALKFR